jgi:hypothetical protein
MPKSLSQNLSTTPNPQGKIRAGKILPKVVRIALLLFVAIVAYKGVQALTRLPAHNDKSKPGIKASGGGSAIGVNVSGSVITTGRTTDSNSAKKPK